MAKLRVPLSCYRLQFNRDFTFRHATDALGYLSRLGITDIYASPLLQSRLGSRHGYDVTDPTRIDSELGNEEQFEAFQSALQKLNMGLLLDIVPNHMAASAENRWWMDVLENGPGSAYAAYFDIDWHPPSLTLDNKILLPVLGKFYGQTLNNRELQLVFRNGRFLIQYYDMSFPLTPKSYRRILKHREHVLEKRLGADSPAFQEYLGIVAALAALPERESLTIDAAGERRLQVAGIKERLRQLHETSREVQRFVAENLKIFNGRRNHPASFRDLDRLLSEQAFVLAYWRNINEAINYRRFFTITDLVGMRVEDPVVFEALHSVILQLIERRVVTGLRIDHIDGLRDPLSYLRRLQQRSSGSPQKKEKANSLYVIVEKILSGAEKLPREWPIQGTTGYEYLNAANRLFVHPEGARAIGQIYFRFLGRELAFEDLLYEKKKLVMSTLLPAEMRYLGRQLGVLAQSDRYARDLPRMELAQALVETTACLPVYRTYIRSMEVPGGAKRLIEHAVDAARIRNPRLDSTCFEFVRDVLLLRDAGHLFAEQREARLAFVMRWQQFTGPIVAKGLEDTILYVYCPLLSLNEVGGNPSPSADAPEFNELASERQRRWPYGLNSTSTHDTKRGEDVRARINVLSEVPLEWQTHLNRWARWNKKKKVTVQSQETPDRNEEVLLYQTLLGSWPLDRKPLDKKEASQFRERLKDYLIKAIREAMVHTRWTLPNTAHEGAVVKFLKAILQPGRDNLFLNDFVKFQRRIAGYGMLNGLAQVLVKMITPGVPDIYQGCDLWDLRLVDPDNRGAVDFQQRAALLDEIEKRSKQDLRRFGRELVQTWQDGRIKLFLIWRVLNIRREYPQVFLDGDFIPIRAGGRRGKNLIAYARRKRDIWIMSVVPRWLAHSKAPIPPASLERYWRGTRLLVQGNAPESWRNVLTGETLRTKDLRDSVSLSLPDILKSFPVAVLVGSTRPA